MKRALFVIAALLAAVPAFAGERIVVPSRDIVRGETIADSDLAYQDVDSARTGIVTSMDALSGMQTRRFLRAGEPVRSDDVKRPVLVAKGTTVTMVFSAPGITLSASGKAMSEGGMGETVTVLNPVSYRQITATVTGPGQVRAGDAPSSPRIASAQ